MKKHLLLLTSLVLAVLFTAFLPITALADSITGDTSIAFGTTLSVNGGSSESWTGGIVTNAGGMLELNSIPAFTSTATMYYGNPTSASSALDINGTTQFTLGTGSTQNYTQGTINANTTGTGFFSLGGNNQISGGTLNVNAGKFIIADTAYVGGSTLTIKLAANTTTTLNGGSLVLQSSDNWSGTIQNTSGALSVASNVQRSTDATMTYNQTGGSLNLSSLLGTAGLTLNAGSAINGGSVTLNSSTLMFSNNTANSAAITIADGSTLKTTGTSNLTLTSGSSIGAAAAVDIGAGTTWTVTGGTLNLDGTDNWAGSIANTGGTVALGTGVNKTTTFGSTYTQTSGTLNMTGGSSLTIGQLGGSITGGTASLTGSTLVLQNNMANSLANITTDGASSLAIGDGLNGTSLTLAGGTIQAGDMINIASKSLLNIAGAAVTLNAGDTWGGSVNLTSGSFTMDGLTKITNTTDTFNQSGGSFTMTGTSTLTMASGSNITGGTTAIDAGSTLNLNGGSLMAAANLTLNGQININNQGLLQLNTGDTWNGGIALNTGGTLDLYNGYVRNAGSTFAMNGGNLNVYAADLYLYTGDSIAMGATFNLGADSTVYVRGGELNMNGITDTWAGSINVGDPSGASTSTVNFLSINKTTTATSTYNQTAGILNMQNSTLTLSDANSTITGGAVNLTQASGLTLGNGSGISNAAVTVDGTSLLTLNTGSNVLDTAQLNLLTNSKVQLNGGNLSLDNNDTWGGLVTVDGGTLVLNNTNQTTTGKLVANTGAVALSAGGLTLRNGDLIAAAVTTILNSGTNTYRVAWASSGHDDRCKNSCQSRQQPCGLNCICRAHFHTLSATNAAR